VYKPSGKFHTVLLHRPNRRCQYVPQRAGLPAVSTVTGSSAADLRCLRLSAARRGEVRSGGLKWSAAKNKHWASLEEVTTTSWWGGRDRTCWLSSLIRTYFNDMVGTTYDVGLYGFIYYDSNMILYFQRSYSSRIFRLLINDSDWRLMIRLWQYCL